MRPVGNLKLQDSNAMAWLWHCAVQLLTSPEKTIECWLVLFCSFGCVSAARFGCTELSTSIFFLCLSNLLLPFHCYSLNGTFCNLRGTFVCNTSKQPIFKNYIHVKNKSNSKLVMMSVKKNKTCCTYNW